MLRALRMDRERRVPKMNRVGTALWGPAERRRDEFVPEADRVSLAGAPARPDGDPRGGPGRGEWRRADGRVFNGVVSVTPAAGGGWRCVLRDMTRHGPFARALEESESKFRLVVEFSPTGLLVVDARGIILLTNRSLESIFGYGRGELLGKSLSLLIPLESRDGHGRHVERYARESVPRPMGAGRDLQGLRRDGARFPVEVGLHPVSWDGQPATLASVTDATARKKAEAAVRESEKRYAVLFLKSPFALAFSRVPDARIVDVNDAFLRLFGFSREEIIGKTGVELGIAGPTDRGAVSGFECARTIRSGERRVLSVSIDFVEFGGEKYTLTTIQDVTELKRLQESSLASAEKERRRIGRDLHDGLGQHLAGVSYLAGLLKESLQSKNLPEAGEAARIGALVAEGLEKLRGISRGLYPSTLMHQGLAPALRELASQSEALFKTPCRAGGVEDVSFPQETAIQLYRIAQEAVQNAFKHARPRRVDISLARKDGAIHLSVKNDGQAPLASFAQGDGMGLRNMEYRARAVGGTFDLRVLPAGGAEVLCVLPRPAGFPR